MKSSRLVSALSLSLLLALVGCEGPAGSEGPAGQGGEDGVSGDDGANGNNGADGANGADGSNGSDGADGLPGTNGGPGTPGFDDAAFTVANNGTTNAGTITERDETWGELATATTGLNEGVAFDTSDNLVQAGDGALVAVRTFCGPLGDGDGYVDGRDREISGPATGLVAPKGIAVGGGYIIVANNGASALSVFGAAAAGDVAPVATTALPANAWDVAWDEATDRLYIALVNGTVGVIDNYVGDGFTGTISRTITPSDAAGAQISTNLHGIAYHADTDRLVVTDVGITTVDLSPDFASDGAVYVIADASVADGNVEPERVIEGLATLLGNPVDVVLDGADARIAEKAQSQLLVFRDVLVGASGDIAPDLAMPSTSPESLAAIPVSDPVTGVSDIIDPATPISGVLVTRNPADLLSPVAGTTVMLSRTLDAVGTSFDTTLASAESVTFSADGDAFVTFDDGLTTGGIAVFGRLDARGATAYDPSRDRMVAGALPSLVAPKGIEVIDAMGLVLVAESEAVEPGIHVFGSCAAGDVAALAVIDTALARPWDIDHDPVTDTLFAAFTNGTVGVYDNVTQDWGVGGPDRLITPSVQGQKVSSNLHGIRYDAGSDTLILSDVGDALVTTDGQLFTIPFAATADGNVDVSKRIAGPLSLLGNPVDIAYDGRDLYVAEKSNNVVSLYRDFLFVEGGDRTPDVATPVTAPESIVLVPASF